MDKKKIKRILISAVSGNDPYNIQTKTDGSLLSIIRKYSMQNTPIDEVYVYLTLETALQEAVNKVYTKSIGFISSDIKITYFPKGVVEEVNEAILEYCEDTFLNHEIDDEEKINIYAKMLYNKNLKIARTDVNKYGKLYEEIDKLINSIIKKEEKDSYELLFNVSSGTPAMEADIVMMAITNKEINSKMIQVATPNKGQNRRLTLAPVDEDSLKKQSRIEEANINKLDENGNKSFRASEEKMLNTKKLILLESIEDSFKKHDYAGVYNAIKLQDSIIKNKDIGRYAKNLYYRYIGDPINAEKGIYLGNIKREELYPIIDNEKNIVVNQFMYTLERLNIMKVKAKREEINDWLLIAESTIESLYKKMIYRICNFDIDSILDDKDRIIIKLPKNYIEKDNNKIAQKEYMPDIINVDSWNEDNYNELLLKEKPLTEVIRPQFLIKPLLEYNGRNINAVILRNLLYTIWENTDKNLKLEDSIEILDALREFRNLAAHTETFITRDVLNQGFKEQILKANRNRVKEGKEPLELKYTTYINAIKEAENILYNILKQIMPEEYTKDANKSVLDKELNIYETIENNIIKLLKEEIY